MKLMNKVKIEWSPNFAYATGLIATDGCLYNDGRHINLTSKDKEQIENFMKCLDLRNKIGKKWNGAKTHTSFVLQFGDRALFDFLVSIGITPKKSKTLNSIKIPSDLFFDFLRGHFDGDGTFYSYMDPRWRSSYMFYTEFISASKGHILWLQNRILELLNIKGHITSSKITSTYQLKYAKTESLKLLPKMYYNHDVVCLSRKRQKIEKALNLLNFQL